MDFRWQDNGSTCRDRDFLRQPAIGGHAQIGGEYTKIIGAIEPIDKMRSHDPVADLETGYTRANRFDHANAIRQGDAVFREIAAIFTAQHHQIAIIETGSRHFNQQLSITRYGRVTFKLV